VGLPRRERWSIVIAILEAIEEQRRLAGEDARVTNVAMRANLPYDRLMLYLQDLAKAGFVTEERMPRLTAKGEDFLRAARQWREVLGRFGLDE
jgi:predicted transcriptional regulator